MVTGWWPHWPHFMLLTPVYAVRLGRHLNRDAGIPSVSLCVSARCCAVRRGPRAAGAGDLAIADRATARRAAESPCALLSADALAEASGEAVATQKSSRAGCCSCSALVRLSSSLLSVHSRTGEYIYLYFIECGDWTDERGAPYTLGRGRGRGANPNVVSSRAERRGPGRVQGAAELLYAYSMPTLCHRETVVGVGGDARQET